MTGNVIFWCLTINVVIFIFMYYSKLSDVFNSKVDQISEMSRSVIIYTTKNKKQTEVSSKDTITII